MNTSAPSNLSLNETAALTRRVTWLSVGVAAVLTLIKVWAWLGTGSVAMLGSLADSGLDLIAALATFYAVRYAVVPPDADHRFGHGKAEAFASLVQAGLVFASAALVGREAVTRLMHPEPLSDGGLGVGVMAASFVLTGLLIAAQSRVLKQANSVAVTGDRTHYVVDLASNLVALVGIGLSALLRNAAIDSIAGLLVVGWLVWGAISVFRSASVELMDQELDHDARRNIITLMTKDPKIKDVHQLRTRASGPYIHMQMHADLDPALNLVEAHKIIVAAEKRLLGAYPAADILIHADPRGFAEPHGGAFGETPYDEPDDEPHNEHGAPQKAAG
jgi:cation diffusion facilitator family transporter